MKQIKIFKPFYTDENNYQAVEAMVNEWLKENPNVNIIDIKFQQNMIVKDYGYDTGLDTEFHPSACVVYETND